MKTIAEPWCQGFELHLSEEVTAQMKAKVQSLDGVEHCTGGGLNGRYRMQITAGKCFDKFEVLARVRKALETT